jgi:protein-arginine kinase activator protein McsA
MDTGIPHYLTQKERTELMVKIQRLEWLLKECIGLEEYELCQQIRDVIKTKYLQLETNQKGNPLQ